MGLSRPMVKSVVGWLAAAVSLGALSNCEKVAQDQILGENAPPERVSLEKIDPPPSAHADDVEEIDENWADRGLVAARFDNMIDRGDEAEQRFRTYLAQLITARGFALETEGLTEAEANAGAQAEWWDDDLYRPMTGGPEATGFRLDDLIRRTVTDAHQVKAFGMLPAIRQTAVREAEGRFTPEAFGEAQISRVDDPATSPALTAGEDRLLSTEGAFEVGVRGLLRTGAEVTLAQRFSAIDTNQTDFVPGEQADSRTTLTIVQPLLRGSGLDLNNAPTRVAELDTKIAQYELIRQLENHLLEVERAYWGLYAARANLFLSRHLADHGRRISGQASARQDVDGDPTLPIKARAARSAWETDIVRAEAAVKNAQFRLAALTNAPELTQSQAELVTLSPPDAVSPKIGRDVILDQMLERRPEVQQAFLQYEASALREGIAANEQLPELDLVLEGVLSGNSDDRDFGGAATDSELGGLIGVRMSIPLGYDERDARYERRRLETIQQRHQTRSALSTVVLELEVSASEYAVAAKDLDFRRRARVDAQRELSALKVQWEDGSGTDTPSTTLESLIGAHERAADQEKAVAEARATLAVAAANFSRARGVLLDRWGIDIAPTDGVRDESIYRLNAALQQ